MTARDERREPRDVRRATGDETGHGASSLVSRLPSLPLRLSSIGVEALDDPATDPGLVRRLLADIAVCNRWLGGTLAMRFGLAKLLQDSDRGHELTLFDIGTGAADLPRDARRWAARRGISLVPLALERIPAAAYVARSAGVPTILGCASALPLRPRSVDVVLLSQVIHHLDADSAVRLLAACTTIARRGVIVADLHRTWFAAPGFRLAGVVLGLHHVTIGDGVTSLQRGYTPPELRALCVRAGASNVTVAARLGARVVAWWRTDQ
jgi:SAM-dependent methyltransferase